MTKEEIWANYEKARDTPSDINQHMETLLEYANKCDTICEMGVRSVVSTWAFLASTASKVTSYDIFDVAVPTADKFTFICADVLTVEIEQTDLLFLDTWHSAYQLKRELKLHADKVNKYLIFHDIISFGENAEPLYNEELRNKIGTDPDVAKGLRYAIEPFLAEHPEWTEEYRTPLNNGLLILRRK